MRKFCISIAILASFTSCKDNKEKDFYVSGTLVDNCEHKSPMRGVVLSCDMNGESFATTTTDSRGKFVLEGTFVRKFKGHEDKPFLVINSEDQPQNPSGGFMHKKLTQLPFEGAVMDTVFYDKNMKVVIDLDVTGSFSESDTLYIQYDSPAGVPPGDKAYHGPFVNGVLDTLLMETHSYSFDESFNLIKYWVTDKDGVRMDGGVYQTKYPPEGTGRVRCEDYVAVTLTLDF